MGLGGSLRVKEGWWVHGRTCLSEGGGVRRLKSCQAWGGGGRGAAGGRKGKAEVKAGVSGWASQRMYAYIPRN